jgi:hypothetical protein
VYAGSWAGGIFRSWDSGTTWSAMNTGLTNLDVACLAIDTLTATTLYAGTFYGEGLVVDLTGPGTIYLQTRNFGAFVNCLVPKLPFKRD